MKPEETAKERGRFVFVFRTKAETEADLLFC